MKNFTQKMITLFFISLLFFSIASAQIVYTDVDPDETYTSGNHYLDLNNDSINDFKFILASGLGGRCGCCYYATIRYAEITPLNLNSVSKMGVDPSKYDSNFILSETAIWSEASNQILRYEKSGFSCPSYSFGHWDSGDGYLGLKLYVGGNIYYGWARLNINVGFGLSFTIKDYAYNSIPNQPILTGETSCTSPTVSIIADGPTTFCDGDSVTLTATGSGYLYQWKNYGVDIAGAKSSTYIAKIAGIYKCKVTNSCGSIVSSGKKVKVPCRLNGYEAFAKDYQINISPNPFINSTTISFFLEQSQGLSLYIYDLNGRLIKTLADNIFNQGENTITWNADNENGNTVSAGIYFLKIQTVEFNQTQKLIVSN